MTDASVSNKLDVVVWSQRRGFVNKIFGGLWRGVEALFDRQGKHQYTGGKHQGHNVNMVAFSYSRRRTCLDSIQQILGGCVAECLLVYIIRALSSPSPSQKSGVEARISRALPDTITTSQGRGMRTITEQAIV